jgi:hypothetical protein
MPSRKMMTKAEREEALAALRARLQKVRQSANRALSGLAAGLEAEEIRQVYACHIAWLEDRIGEVEARSAADEPG